MPFVPKIRERNYRARRAKHSIHNGNNNAEMRAAGERRANDGRTTGESLAGCPNYVKELMQFAVLCARARIFFFCFALGAKMKSFFVCTFGPLLRRLLLCVSRRFPGKFDNIFWAREFFFSSLSHRWEHKNVDDTRAQNARYIAT